ncbi:Pheromone-regulated membrane protein 10 [Alternaria tenuissima]|uniref:Pheromone-regulated membrane protein 10 n=1 Tax=Alternaria tenuissima TaxID=119927 RepID=A0A4Q4MUM1_9PLEO|nr:Pheromone-regulated membrane protein 10 [Alternaria tenuissima]
MEPSSTNSSEHTHVDEHEMQQIPPTYPTPSVQPEQATGKTRVRFNSSANVEVPPPPLEQIRSYSRVSESGSNEITTNQHTVDAEELLNAHNAGELNAQNFNALPLSEVDPDGAYTVTGNANGGVFYQLLQAYKTPVRGYTDTSSEVSETSPSQRPGSSSGACTPKRKWYNANKPIQSTETLATLIGASAKLANPKDVPLRPRNHRRTSSNNIIAKVWKAKEDQDAKIKIHVANILKRQQYIIRMCRALMLFGAPTHRLEEYLATTAKVLEINSQFLYIPGCMIISFDDNLTHTAEVKIVRTAQGVNLGKLKDTHDIYKEVLHDVISLDEALARLDEVINAKDRHPRWLTVLMYGLASAAVSCFFKARPIDMPVIFVLGIVLGLLQLVIAPLSKTYSTVFEITATILMSFLARAFGSINNGNLFCFSAIAQSAIALILPGWLVLSSALELQSRAIVPGSIRLVFAIIYSLFLGYGITVGTAIYGAIDSNATNSTQCQSPMNPYWNFLMVPLYVFFTTFTVQAKYKQMPAMIVIAFAGYIVNFYAGMKFSSSAPIAYTFGAFTIGVLANLYSRLRHGVAAAVLLPAVYVQVPGSLASSGSINSALQTASALIKGSGGAADVSTSSFPAKLITDVMQTTTDSLNAIVFNVAASMIQIAIGITVGLFMAALLVYPMGKRRSGLWTL